MMPSGETDGIHERGEEWGWRMDGDFHVYFIHSHVVRMLPRKHILLYFLIKILFKKIFIWLHGVSVVADGLLSCGRWTPYFWLQGSLVVAHRLLSCGM